MSSMRPRYLPSCIRNKGRKTFRRFLTLFSTGLLLASLFLLHKPNTRPHDAAKGNQLLNDGSPFELKGISPRYVNGGVIFRVPGTWNRLLSPWLKKSEVKFLNPKQSRHRYLYGPSRLMTSDGIGHSMGAINLEFNLALSMNLTYTHRVGFYSSLSRRDRFAVENFFGWGVGEVRRKRVQEQGCSPKGGRWPDEKDLYACHVCDKPLHNGSMDIKTVVDIPDVFLDAGCQSPEAMCWKKLHEFIQNNSLSHSIFQLPEKTCSPPKTDANLLRTKDIFFNKYWKKHGRLPWMVTDGYTESHTQQRITLNPGELNVAIHSRRGDFLNPQLGRTLTNDTTFAAVLQEVLRVIQNTGTVFAIMPIAVHVYSEGKLLKKNALSSHSVELQDKNYYDHEGLARSENWWKTLILSRLKTIKNHRPSVVRWEDKLRIKFHISEDTLSSLHNMIAADLFIGSHSGLSTHLVRSMSRGVSLLPHSSGIDTEIGKKGYICCSVPFNNDNGVFSLSTFEWYWRAYVSANVDSAYYSLKQHSDTQST